MKTPIPILAAAMLTAAAVSLLGIAADAEPRNQDEMRAAIGKRSVLKSGDIEARILPKMHGMQYIGPEYDAVAMAYRLKFISNGRVVFVDVDARTGRIIDEHR